MLYIAINTSYVINCSCQLNFLQSDASYKIKCDQRLNTSHHKIKFIIIMFEGTSTGVLAGLC